MLAPEFAMLPAVYAQDETPAHTQTVDIAEDAEAPAAADTADLSAGNGEAAAADPESGDLPSDAGLEPEDQAAGDTSGTALEAGNDTETAGEEEAVVAEPAVPLAAGTAEETAATPAEFGSYDNLLIADLYDAKKFVISQDMQGKIKVAPAEYSKGLVFTGKVADLNSTVFTIDKEFDFNSGGVGRFNIDGLKDKDRGMNVDVEVYLDGSESPAATASLKKQMGKKEWSSKGEKSVSFGSSEISGKHRIAFRLKITGKEDKKETSVMLKSVQFCRTTLPVMYFNIDESEGTVEAMNTSEDHSAECYGTVDLVVPDKFNSDTTFRDEYGEQESLYDLDLEYIRGRGNSTWMDDKKPYKVKFDKKQDLFGFGSNAHWVLLANRFDNSFVRNRMTYWLGQQLGLEYTPQCVPVEVVMNGEFYGSYLLCEQIRVGKGRVTIDDLDDEDPLAITDELVKTGGYLLSMDGWVNDENRSFNTESGMSFYIESPDDNVKYFNDYIKAYTQKVENAILGEGFMDDQGHPYTDYLDLDSAVDYWWVQEFSSNGDAYTSGSTYLYKKRDSKTDPGKLYWGPLWDFDFVAWGDLDYAIDPSATIDYTSTPWFDAMKSDPVFINRIKERWTEKGGLKDKLIEITKKGGRLDKYIAQMETSYIYDHDKWGAYESTLTEYKDEVEQLRAWINKRIEYVDAEVSALSTEPQHVKFIVDGKVVKETDVISTLQKKDFPAEPKKKGLVFAGWIDKDGIEYYNGARVTSPLELTANFMKESAVIKPKNLFFKSYDVYFPIYPQNSYNTEDWYYPDYRIMPVTEADETITWTSSNPDIAECAEEGDFIKINAIGDATITGTLSNGVTNSFKLHVLNYEDFKEWETSKLDRTSMTLKTGGYRQVKIVSSPVPCEPPEFLWVSTNEAVATVDEIGVVTAVAPGTADIMAVNTMTREVLKCKVTVKANNNVGKTVKRSGSTYKITSDKKSKRRAMLVKAKNAKTVTIPSYIKLNGKKYDVNKIKSKAFAKSKATKVIIKTKKLTKQCVKASLKNSKVKNIKVSTGKKTRKTYIKKYKKIFTKKNAGRKVKVS